MAGSKSKSKRMVGVSLDYEVVDWLDSIVKELKNRNVVMNRSQLINYMLNKLKSRYSIEEVVERILKEKI